jgi:hypothetical protein
MRTSAASAIGRLERDGAWVGFVREADGGFHLAFGDGLEARATTSTDVATRRADLLAVAIAYFAEVFTDAPAELEATQRDIADLVRWLTATAPDSAQARQLQEALDGVDDGLAADVLIARLTAALAVADPDRPADAVSRLRDIHRSSRRSGRR